MERQIKYSATNDKAWEVPNRFNPKYIDKLSSLDELAHLINSAWKHSWHWNYSDYKKLYEQINDSLNDEIKHAEQRMAGLMRAKEILENISEPVEEETP